MQQPENMRKELTGKAFIYSRISLKLLKSCVAPEGPSMGLCSTKLCQVLAALNLWLMSGNLKKSAVAK